MIRITEEVLQKTLRGVTFIFHASLQNVCPLWCSFCSSAKVLHPVAFFCSLPAQRFDPSSQKTPQQSNFTVGRILLSTNSTYLSCFLFYFYHICLFPFRLRRLSVHLIYMFVNCGRKWRQYALMSTKKRSYELRLWKMLHHTTVSEALRYIQFSFFMRPPHASVLAFV